MSEQKSIDNKQKQCKNRNSDKYFNKVVIDEFAYIDDASQATKKHKTKTETPIMQNPTIISNFLPKTPNLNPEPNKKILPANPPITRIPPPDHKPL